MQTEGTTRNNFNFVAQFYDGLSHVYSGGQIRACKESQVAHLRAGDRVLYAGVGGGEDATLAALHGAHVTVIDLAPSMLARAQRRFESAGVADRVNVICGDILQHDHADGYDAVVANFFLNVFSEPVMKQILGHLAGQVKPGGALLIADFAPRTGSLAQWAYWNFALYSFKLLANNALHEIYDYSRYLAPLGLRLDETRDFKLFGRGPAWYRTLKASKLPTDRDR